MHATVPTPHSSARRLRICCSAILILLASMLALTSCATGTEVMKAPPVAPAPPPPAIDRSLLAQCPELPPAVDSRLASLLANHDETTALHHDCRAGKSALVAAVEEWQRTAWEWYCTSLESVGLDASSCRAGLEPRR